METNFTVEFQGTYIHVRHAEGFAITPESLNYLYQEIAIISQQHRCKLVFAEGSDISRHISLTGAFDSGNRVASSINGLTMACFLEGYKTDELTDFFKTVARNRGANIEFFSERKAAFQWLGIDPPQEHPVGKSSDNGAGHYF